MKKLPVLSVFVALLAACGGSPRSSPAYAATSFPAEDWSWRERLAPGATLEVRNINGAIKVDAASGDTVEVVGHKDARRDDAEDVKLEVVEHAGGVTICAIYPAPPGAPANTCKPGGGRMESSDRNHVPVAIAIKLPAGLHFIGRTINGGIETKNLGGDADVSSVNGSIRVSSPGQVRANTVNGSIHASFGRTAWTGEIRVATVNGSVTVELPAEASTEVSLGTVNGRIDSDFGLAGMTVEPRKPRKLAGTIGAGGRQLKVDTVNGSVNIRRRS
jgi:hypothetical protein